MNKLKLFFVLSKWAWVICLPYIPVFGILLFILLQFVSLPIALAIMVIPTAVDFYFAGRIFLDFPRKYHELERLNKMYQENGKVSKYLLYSMRCTLCEKVVEKEFERLNNYQLD